MMTLTYFEEYRLIHDFLDFRINKFKKKSMKLLNIA